LGADALLVGVNTILTDDPELTYRGLKLKSRPLVRVLLDSNLRTPVSAKLFQTEPQTPVLIFCGRNAPKIFQKELERRGAEIVRIARSQNGLDLRAVVDELGKRDILGLLVEGGSGIHWSFLSEDLVDKFYFIIAPMVLGGRDAAVPVGGQGYKTIEDSAKFKVSRHFSMGPDVILEAYPSRSRSIISPWPSQEISPSRERYYPLPSTRK
jgi:diaminohydroxyphosphoribosylaminopyrimidine deaminase/5-amino-6-(5-phosphoribosylamino)uracil reductase